jgi:hypothetical protein
MTDKTMFTRFKKTCFYLLAFSLILLTTSGLSCSTDTVDYASPASRDNLTYSPDGKGFRFDKNGWIYLHIEGEPYERGFQHGYLVAPELEEILRSLDYLTYLQTGKKWEFFVTEAEKQFGTYTEGEYAEYLEEVKGIAEGAGKAGVDISWQEVLTWNGYSELLGYWWPNAKAGKYGELPDNDHCSAFIATGSYTGDGKIVMAHNEWNQYAIAQFFNLILDMEPAKGNRIFMQSGPGFVYSHTDFFITGAGIVGTETTIGAFSSFDPDGAPDFFRIRNAMQYGTGLDDFMELLSANNNGGYANSWLLGDINTGEIMRYELGLKYSAVERTTDGYFAGYNAPTDPQLRNLECGDTGYDDIRQPAGARRVRLTQLLEQYRGKIDIPVARDILSDHYDVYLKTENPCSRTIEARYDLDAFQYWQARKPYQPSGTTDGKVLDSNMARSFSFQARWGSSSGMPFYADEYFAEHPQWDYLEGYIQDRPTQPWTLFDAGQK